MGGPHRQVGNPQSYSDEGDSVLLLVLWGETAV